MYGGWLLAEEEKRLRMGLVIWCCIALDCGIFLLGCLGPSPRLEIASTIAKDSRQPPAAGDTGHIGLVLTTCGRGNCFICIASNCWLCLHFNFFSFEFLWQEIKVESLELPGK